MPRWSATKGWEALPEDVRQPGGHAWFRSLLLFDPAQVMPHVKQPILIVQGDLDNAGAAAHADKLAELARARKKAPARRGRAHARRQSPARSGDHR